MAQRIECRQNNYADLNLIIKAFGMKIPNKMFIRRGDIKEMKSSIEKVK